MHPSDGFISTSTSPDTVKSGPAYTRDKYLKEVLETFAEPQRTQYIEELRYLARQTLNSDDLTWDTMCLLFKKGDSVIMHWASLFPVPPDILVAAERAVASWDKLPSGNPEYANYDANSSKNRGAIARNLEKLKKRQP